MCLYDSKLKVNFERNRPCRNQCLDGEKSLILFYIKKCIIYKLGVAHIPINPDSRGRKIMSSRLIWTTEGV